MYSKQYLTGNVYKFSGQGSFHIYQHYILKNKQFCIFFSIQEVNETPKIGHCVIQGRVICMSEFTCSCFYNLNL